MEYQKIINLLENAPNQPTGFSTKSWERISLIVKLNLRFQC